MAPPPAIASTFRDDPAIRERDVLGAAAGDDRDWGVQAQALLDAHGQEGQPAPEANISQTSDGHDLISAELSALGVARGRSGRQRRSGPDKQVEPRAFGKEGCQEFI